MLDPLDHSRFTIKRRDYSKVNESYCYQDFFLPSSDFHKRNVKRLCKTIIHSNDGKASKFKMNSLFFFFLYIMTNANKENSIQIPIQTDNNPTFRVIEEFARQRFCQPENLDLRDITIKGQLSHNIICHCKTVPLKLITRFCSRVNVPITEVLF